MSIIPALIPLRDSQPLFGNTLDPIHPFQCNCRKFWNNNTNVEQNHVHWPYIPLVNTLEAPAQVLGRFDFFLSTWTACSCITLDLHNNNPTFPHPTCPRCKESSTTWAKDLISRTFFQLELYSTKDWIWKLIPVGLNVTALVQINGISLQQQQQTQSFEEDSHHRVWFPLRMGSTLSFVNANFSNSSVEELYNKASLHFLVGWVSIVAEENGSQDSRIMSTIDTAFLARPVGDPTVGVEEQQPVVYEQPMGNKQSLKVPMVVDEQPVGNEQQLREKDVSRDSSRIISNNNPTVLVRPLVVNPTVGIEEQQPVVYEQPMGNVQTPQVPMVVDEQPMGDEQQLMVYRINSTTAPVAKAATVDTKPSTSDSEFPVLVNVASTVKNMTPDSHGQVETSCSSNSDLYMTDNNLIVKEVVASHERPNDSKRITVFLLTLGRNMSTTRVQSLTKNFQSKVKDIEVLSSFDKKHPPTILVVDAKVDAVQVTTALGFIKPEEFHSFLQENMIQVVIPEWMIKCQLTSDIPGEFRWSGTKQMMKKSTGWLSKRKESHEIGPLKFVKASACSDPIVQRELKRRKEVIQEEESQDTKASEVQTDRVATVSSASSVAAKYPKNEELSSLMNQISALYQECPLQESDEWRSYSYKKTAGLLRYLDFEVNKDPDVLKKLRAIHGIGSKVMVHIEEYLKFNKCALVEQLMNHPQRAAVRNLINIWGVGPTKAFHMATLGCKDITDVRKLLNNKNESNKLSLSKNILIGVKYYENFLEKMDRAEVTKIGEIVEKAVHKIFHEATVSIMGSYRRGKAQCGDVDILITHPKHVETTPLGAIDWLVELLKYDGHITDHLTSVDTEVFKRLPRQNRNDDSNNESFIDSYDEWFLDHKGSASYMGVFASPLHPETRRRIDIKFYPMNEQATAILYFTGSGYFNRSMRLIAKKKHFHLDDHGLYVASSKGERMQRLVMNTEQDVFDTLGLEYKEPHERESFESVQQKGALEPTFPDEDE